MCKVVVSIVTIGMAAISLANPAHAGNGSAVGAGLLGLVLGLWLAARLHRKRCMSPRRRLSITPHRRLLLRPTSSCLCSASARLRWAGVLWPSATSRLSPLTIYDSGTWAGPLGDNYAGGTSISRCEVGGFVEEFWASFRAGDTEPAKTTLNQIATIIVNDAAQTKGTN